MEPLEPAEVHHLNAALGWVGLSNLAEAKGELTGIAAERLSHPDVLEVRWLILAEEKAWAEGLVVARQLVTAAPRRASAWLHQAYALRRAPGGSVKAAWKALLPAFDKFPKEPTISYNLACYACQMGQLDAARVWFKRALVIGGKEKIRAMGLADTDLQPLWEEIKHF